MNTSKRAVIITGAGKGIGHATTLRLARNGFRVYAGVRDLADGEMLKKAGDVVPVRIDITDQATIDAAAARVQESIGDVALAGLVNNAGIAVAGPLEFMPISELRRQLDVNVVGQLAMVQAFLPLLRAAKGRIVNIGSIAGRSAMPMMGPYAASKFALEALTDSLRIELMPWGVDVVIIEPGLIATPIWDTSIKSADQNVAAMPPLALEYYGKIIQFARNLALTADQRGLPPDEVAKVVEHVLNANKPKTRYLIGRDAKLRAMLQRLPDRFRDRLIWRRLR